MKTLSLIRPTVVALTLAAGLLTGGCASYEIKVDAIARANVAYADLGSYRICSADPAVECDNLRFKEAAEQIKTALSARGMWEAADARDAAMVIDIDYGVGPPRVVVETVTLPLLPPLERSNSAVRVTDPSLPDAPNSADPETYERPLAPILLREKHLTASCRENKPSVAGQPPLELWRVDVSVEDEGKDLREYLPVLATAVVAQIGATTDGIETIRLRKNDDAIAFVKKGM